MQGGKVAEKTRKSYNNGMQGGLAWIIKYEKCENQNIRCLMNLYTRLFLYQRE